LKSEIDRLSTEKEKEGFFLGKYAVNPLTVKEYQFMLVITCLQSTAQALSWQCQLMMNATTLSQLNTTFHKTSGGSKT